MFKISPDYGKTSRLYLCMSLQATKKELAPSDLTHFRLTMLPCLAYLQLPVAALKIRMDTHPALLLVSDKVNTADTACHWKLCSQPRVSGGEAALSVSSAAVVLLPPTKIFTQAAHIQTNTGIVHMDTENVVKVKIKTKVPSAFLTTLSAPLQTL